jgi:hypothetical protein
MKSKKRRILDCQEDTTPHPRYILPPLFHGLKCDLSCPQLIYSRRNLDSIYAHCMRYYVPLSAEVIRPQYVEVVLRHLTCQKEFPEAPPPLPKEAST